MSDRASAVWSERDGFIVERVKTAGKRAKRDQMSDRNYKEDGETAVITKRKTALKLKRPKLYKVLLHNDDFTTMEFVVDILQVVFAHDETSAMAIMLHIHRHGVGVGGIYPFSVAEAKVGEVIARAEKAEYPLLCTMEPDDDDEGGGEDGKDEDKAGR